MIRTHTRAHTHAQQLVILTNDRDASVTDGNLAETLSLSFVCTLGYNITLRARKRERVCVRVCQQSYAALPSLQAEARCSDEDLQLL